MIAQASFVAPGVLRIARGSSLIAFLLLAACGTERFYEGAKLPPDQVAIIHVGDTTVMQVDRQDRRGGYLGKPRIEVTPGSHALTLAFEKPARPVGAKEMPAMHGEGTCTLELNAQAGKQYYLGAQAVGEDWTGSRWDGKWRAWARDPSVGGEDDVIARCDSQLVEEEMPTPAAGKGVAVGTPVPAVRQTPVPVPAVAAVAPVSGSPSVPFTGGLDPALWIVRSRDNYRVVVRRFCSADRCSTLSYLQTLVPRSVVNDGTSQLVMEEKTTVPIEEANAPSAFVEDVRSVDRQGTFAFELSITNADDPDRAPRRLLVYPSPDGRYRVSRTGSR